MAHYKLVNVVGGDKLGIEIDLYNAVSALNQYEASYEPEQSPGMHFKLPSTAVTAMLFRTGEYHLTGGKSVGQIQKAGEELITILENELSLDLNPPEADIRNLVYSGDIGREVCLETISSDLKGDVLYEPSKHASLQYRKDDWDGVIMLFRTGSFTYVGSNNQEKAEEALGCFTQKIKNMI